MKTFEIILDNGEVIEVQGEIITHCEVTGQSFIYSDNNPVYTCIAAIIPAKAFVRVLSDIDPDVPKLK